MEVIKCLTHFYPTRGQKQSPNPKLRNNSDATANPNFTDRYFMLRLEGHFVTFISVNRTLRYVYIS